MEIAASIFLIAFCIPLMFIIPRFSQWNRYDINPEHFKKIKVQKLHFLFSGLGGKDCIYHSVKKYGVILPMFIYQISGYLCAIIAVGLTLILLFIFNLELTSIAIINFGILLSDSVLGAILTCSCAIITNKKDKYQ